MGFRSHTNPVWPHLILIKSTKILFPNKVILQVLRVRTSLFFFRGERLPEPITLWFSSVTVAHNSHYYYAYSTLSTRDFPGGSDGKVVKPTMRETGVQSLAWEDLLEKEMATHSSILAWKIPWRKIGLATVHGVAKSWTRLSDFSTST